MDCIKVASELSQLAVTHQQPHRCNQIGVVQDGVTPIRLQQQLLWQRIRLRIGDQILTHLTVNVVVACLVIERVKADCYTIHQLVRVVGMHQNPHRRFLVVDAIEVSLYKRPVIPEARPYPFDRLVDPVFRGLAVVLRLGVVQPGAAESRQVLIVGAGSVAQ